MKRHTTIAADTLNSSLKKFPGVSFLKMARDIAESHHEKCDGTGYPKGLRGENIPLCGRILALGDVYDALISKRVYKSGMTHEEAKQIILDGTGTHFDPDVVQCFLNREDQFIAIRNRFNDEKEEE